MSAKYGGNGCRDEFFVKRLEAYEPIYFVVGNDDDVGYNAKFQISVDFKFFCAGDDMDEGTAEGSGRSVLRRLSEVHLGFSQTSIWDLSELSSPFRDSIASAPIRLRMPTRRISSSREKHSKATHCASHRPPCTGGSGKR
jgi:hypothetical protein